MSIKEAYIVAATRTACGKANKGSLRFTRPDSMGGAVIKELLKRTPEVSPEMVEDVIMGCAFPEASQGLNVAKQIAALGGLPDEVPGVTVNRFCSSGLQTIAMAAERIMVGAADVIVAGGVESMSLVPMGGMSVQPNPELVDNKPELYISMGLTAENVADKYGVSREDQDAFAYQSHQRAITAWENGRFDSQIAPIVVVEKKISADGEIIEEKFTFRKDEGPRADTSKEVLAKLRAVFKAGGSVTAGNSSQMNDAAAGVIVMSGEKVKELGLTPIARYVGFSVAGVAPELMGIGPVEAIPKVLKQTGLKLSDIDLIELNEAFAAQSLAVIRELGIDQEITNVNGGAIAMGHPLGCTGAKLTAQILHEMQSRKSKYGMVTMCIGGGMGAAGIFENLS
ncbi:MAG: acetyl-CoA C-acyltransferase [Balneola sp.]|nr:acetyl-CoA C-acyltransferase [Balneola sp.]MBO6650859.1 acetyl-CoA C-acyltransferase [Balneola sp.]MBO6710032.1 acetyl-CoA C-acyltransferase [Balneola sp.]MBO6798716.1 acetyl-CoA C-acyltransferase [Balneola sp.]MBO6869830.1 acetyl-CoA C-acyltransferase [Balneola sp.]